MHSQQTADELLRAGDVQGALHEYERLIQEGAENALAYQGAAQCYYQMRKFDEALAAGREAIKLRADLSAAHSIVAYALYRSGKKADSLVEARQAYDLGPGSPEAADCYGTILLAMGKAEEAIPPLRRALEQDSELISASNNLAIAYRDTNQRKLYLQQTISLFEQKRSFHNAIKMVEAGVVTYAGAISILVAVATLLAFVIRVPSLLLIPLIAIVRGWIIAFRFLRERNWLKAISFLLGATVAAGILYVLFVVAFR